jgi:Fic family protein
MPETIDTAREIVNIKRDIRDIKQSQEADMHLNREKYQKLVYDALFGNQIRVKVFLAVDGIKSGKEIQNVVGGSQPTVWRALDHLVSFGVIVVLEQTKGGRPVFDKPRWAKTLRIDDYVRKTFPIPTTAEQPKEQPQSGNSDS